MPRLPYSAFDADNHYYEALDAFTRHLDRKLASRAVQWTEVRGRPRLLVAEKINHFIPNPTFDPVAKPGCLDDYYQGKNTAGQSTADFLVGAADPAAKCRGYFWDIISCMIAINFDNCF